MTKWLGEYIFTLSFASRVAKVNIFIFLLGYIPDNKVDVYVPGKHDGSVMCPSGHEVLTAQQLFNERDDDFPATHLTITRICDECHKEIIIEIAY